MTTTLGTILDIQPAQREADAATLARSLYEHAIHFVFLAADPSPDRLRQWRIYDVEEALKADNDMRRYGHPMFTATRRAELQSEVDSFVGHKLPNLGAMAVAADKHWAGRLNGLDSRTELRSFGGLYASLYRFYSGMAHPSGLGLLRVVDSVAPTRRRVRLEGQYHGTGPYSMATIVFAWALHVAAQSLGWPLSHEVNAAFADSAGGE